MINFNKAKGLFTLLAVFLLTSLAGVSTVKACHFAAADISIKYVGAGSNGCSGTSSYDYEVELRIYYACISCQGSGGVNATINWASASAQADGLPNATGNKVLVDPQTNIDTTHDLCEAFADSNSCKTNLATASRYPAFKVRKHVGPITLPYARTDWRFWWSGSARSNSNLNLTGCTSLYVEAGLDNQTKYNNSTVKFTSNPLPYICVNQTTIYDNLPVDPEGDSINVELQPPYHNQTTTCTYNAPSTLANPMNSSTGFNLNKATGSATFTPSATGQFVLAFRGEDYLEGTGTRMSYVYRDVQTSVLPCNEPPPAIDSLKQAVQSISGGSVINTSAKGDVVFVCPGSNVSFDLNTTSIDPSHIVVMYGTPSPGMAASTFTVSGQGTGSVTGTFNWTPTTADIGEHQLLVESRDSTCLLSQPILLTSRRIVFVKVMAGLDAGPDLPICELNIIPQQLFVRGYEDLDIRWEMLGGGPAIGLSDNKIHNPVANVEGTTSFVVATDDLKGACKNRDTITLFIDETNKVTITPKNPNNAEDALVMCRPGYLQLEAILDGKPPKNNVPCGVGNPTLCSNQDTGYVFGSPLYGNITNDSIGEVSPILFNTNYTTKYQYLIRKDEMAKGDIYSNTLRSIGFETVGTTTPNYEYGNFRILIKCTEKTQLDETKGFENFGMTQVYSAPTVMFDNGMHYFPLSTPYSWDTTKNLIVQICYSDNPQLDTNCGTSSTPPVIKFASTTYQSGLMLVGSNLAVKSVCGVAKDPAIRAVYTRPAFTFSYCEADPLDFIITWNQGEYLTDTTILQPLAYVPKSARFVVQTVGRSDCVMRDTLDVYIPEHDFRVEPQDTAFCLGDKAPFAVFGGHYFKWYEYDAAIDSFLTPVSVNDPFKGYTFIGPQRSTDYKIVVSDSVWCYDTLSAKIKILPLPDVRILNKDDTTIKYGQSFQLLASGARLYNWSPVSSLNNPNISYPMARPREDTKYIVGGIATNGCRAFDTLHVTVDKRDNLFVPSAFSPNGDGKNDVFKVTNLSFQRILEFRVFNRWGQEVFSTNDSRTGWDGTWEGKPQGIGNYSYLIRVAYPDGFVETYKGETTLIR